jgi:8-oxo-dGTP diphosphatase
VIRVGAAVVQRGVRLLVCKRPSSKRHGGLFEFPGGKLLDAETLADGLTRELREELGVDVTAVGEVRFSVVDPGSEFLIEFVEVSVVGEPVALEHDEIRWVTAAEIHELPLAPSDRAFAATLD